MWEKGEERRTSRISNHAQQTASALIFLIFLLGLRGDVLLLLLLLFFVVGHLVL
jgi:hypothetical protein